MSQPLVLEVELSEEAFAALCRQAFLTGASPSQVTRVVLEDHYRRQALRPSWEETVRKGLKRPEDFPMVPTPDLAHLNGVVGNGPMAPSFPLPKETHGEVPSTGPSAASQPDAEELARAMDRLVRLFSSYRSGRPLGTDNEQIDADLARAYAGDS